MIRRRVVRGICLNPAGEMLAIRGADPMDPRRWWWELPGGGVDPGETDQLALMREFREEAGLTQLRVERLLYTNHAIFEFAGWQFDQHEFIYLVRSEFTAIEFGHLELFERMAFAEIRWWNIAEFASMDPPTVPVRLTEFLPAMDPENPDHEVLDITAPPAAPVPIQDT